MRLLGRATVDFSATDGTSGYELWVTDGTVGGTHELFFVFLRNPGDASLFVLNWMEFQGAGSTNAPPIILQSAPDVTEAFADEGSAVVNPGAKTVTIPKNTTARFYRLRSTAPTRILNVQIIGPNVVLTYE